MFEELNYKISQLERQIRCICTSINESGGGLPDQAGHGGEFLTTDGSTASWDVIPAAINIYNSDGTVIGDRNVSLQTGGKVLNFIAENGINLLQIYGGGSAGDFGSVEITDGTETSYLNITPDHAQLSNYGTDSNEFVVLPDSTTSSKKLVYTSDFSPFSGDEIPSADWVDAQIVANSVNIYNTSGSIPASTARSVNLNIDTFLQVGYVNGSNGFRVYSGNDVLSTGGYTVIGSPDANSAVRVDDTSGVTLSNGGTQVVLSSTLTTITNKAQYAASYTPFSGQQIPDAAWVLAQIPSSIYTGSGTIANAVVSTLTNSWTVDHANGVNALSINNDISNGVWLSNNANTSYLSISTSSTGSAEMGTPSYFIGVYQNAGIQLGGKTLVVDGSFANEASAVFQINSTTRGLLPPRMTTTERNAIASPADGLMLYNSTTGKFTGRQSAAWVEFGTGNGDIVNGGNSGATTIGTNTNDALVFETNNVVRLTISSAAAGGGTITSDQITSNTSSIANALIIGMNSTGTAAANFGSRILFNLESSTTNDQNAAAIDVYWNTATHASREAAIGFSVGDNGGALSQVFSIDRADVSGSGRVLVGNSNPLEIRAGVILANQGLIIGNSVQNLTLGGSSGQTTLGGSSGLVIVSSSATNTQAIFINGSAAGSGIIITNANNNPTIPVVQISGNVSRNNSTQAVTSLKIAESLAPTSGALGGIGIDVAQVINQTATASGSYVGVKITPTLTALLGTFTALEIGVNNASSKGIYQSGPLTTNNFAGPTNIGSLNAPVALTPLTVEYATANTATVQDMIVIRTNSTGTAGVGFGGGILFAGEFSTTDNRDMIRLASSWAVATDATRRSQLAIQGVSAGGAITTLALFDGLGTLSVGSTAAAIFANNGITSATGFTVGGSIQLLTLGGSSGDIIMSSSGATTQNISISALSNSSSSTAGISIGGSTTFNGQTSGTRNYMSFGYTFSPTSGSAIHNQLVFSSTFNQTGGASGITRSIYGNPTLTAVADYRFLEFTGSHANAKFLYHSGTAPSMITGSVAIGSVTSPVDVLDVTGNISLLSAGNKIKIKTGSNASIGTATLVGGTVTVNTTAVTANSIIMVSHNTPGGTVGIVSAPVGSIVAGTSFVINSSSGTDTSTINWWIIN